MGLELKKQLGKIALLSFFWANVGPLTLVKIYFQKNSILGKHNGTVNGRKYFTCRDGHGVIVKPRNISVHGINGTELLRPESYYPI